VILYLLLTKKSMKLLWNLHNNNLKVSCTNYKHIVPIFHQARHDWNKHIIWEESYEHKHLTTNEATRKISKLVKKSRSSIYLPPLVLDFFQCLGSLGNFLVTTFLSCKLTFLCCMIINKKINSRSSIWF